MENLGEKSGEKEVLRGVWLGGGVEKNEINERRRHKNTYKN